MRHFGFVATLLLIGSSASGIGLAPIAWAATPSKQSIEVDQRARMLALYKEEQQARHRDSGPWALAAAGLDTCASLRQMSNREEVCMRTQGYVDACMAAGSDWNRRKAALLAEIRKSDPNLGKEYTPNTSIIRGAPNQPDQQQRWNDTVRGLESMNLPACQSTLPGTSLTPEAALREWTAQDAAPVAAPPRRGSNAGTDRFREMNTVAERDQATPGGRDARLQAEKEEQARIAREYANRQGTEEILLSGLFAATMGIAQIQAQRNPSDPGAALLSAISGNVPGNAAGNSSMGSDALPAISSSASGSAGAGGASCEDALNSLIGPMNDGRPPNIGGSYTASQDAEQSVWAMQVYLQVANSLPNCASSPARQTVANNLSTAQNSCRQARGASCSSGRNYYVNTARLEAAIRQIQQGSDSGSSTNPQRANASGGSPAGASACENAYAGKDAEMQSLQRQAPAGQGAVASMQLLLYMIDQLKGVLNSSVCAGQPGRNRLASLEQTEKSTMNNCNAIATNRLDCAPRRPL